MVYISYEYFKIKNSVFLFQMSSSKYYDSYFNIFYLVKRKNIYRSPLNVINDILMAGDST